MTFLYINMIIVYNKVQFTNCITINDFDYTSKPIRNTWSLALTHWCRVTHRCVSKLPIIASDNGLASARRQAIIWTTDGIPLIWPLWTNFCEILRDIHIFSFKKMHLKMSFGKSRPFCPGLNDSGLVTHLCAILEYRTDISQTCVSQHGPFCKT